MPSIVNVMESDTCNKVNNYFVISLVILYIKTLCVDMDNINVT